jgi:hypothetical protein
MMEIDRQRIPAVRTLEALGFRYRDGDWLAIDAVAAASLLSTSESDAMYATLIRRADALAGCTEGSEEEAELEAIADVLEAYEKRRWPEGRELGGKG